MCGNPMVAMALQGAGAGVSAVGAYGEAASKKSSLNYQAQMSDLNAVYAERRAQIATDQGALEAGEIEKSGARTKATAKATLASRGIALDEGTALAIQTGIDVVTAEDAQQARVNAVRAAWGHRADAVNSRNEALMGRATAKGINPTMAAYTSLLGSATSMAESHYAVKRAGGYSRAGR